MITLRGYVNSVWGKATETILVFEGKTYKLPSLGPLLGRLCLAQMAPWPVTLELNGDTVDAVTVELESDFSLEFRPPEAMIPTKIL
jgi:hypothetical protein